jgi:hypothetical protein
MGKERERGTREHSSVISRTVPPAARQRVRLNTVARSSPRELLGLVAHVGVSAGGNLLTEGASTLWQKQTLQ